MRAVKVLMVGLEAQVQQACVQLLDEVLGSVDYTVCEQAALPPEGESYAFGLLGNGEDEASACLVMQAWAGFPWIVFSARFEAGLVARLQNGGAARVLPVDQFAELLPDCVCVLLARPASALPGNRNDQARINAGSPSLEAEILGDLHLMVVAASADGNIVYMNRAAELASGYAFQEIAGHKFTDLFPPEEKEAAWNGFRGSLNPETPRKSHNSWLTRDGRVIWVEWTHIAILSENGCPCWVAVGLDATNSRLAQESYLEKENRFSRVFQDSAVGLGIIRYSTGCFTNVNEALLGLLGARREEVIGQNFADIGLIAPEKNKQMMDEVIQRSYVRILEPSIRQDASRQIHLSISLQTVQWPDEIVILVVVENVTEFFLAEERFRKKNDQMERWVLERTAALEVANRELAAEVSIRKAVEESSERLIQILWENPDVVAICSIGGQIIYLNKAGRQLLGLSETDLVHHLSVYDFYSQEQRASIRSRIALHVARDGIWRGELELMVRGSQTIPVAQVFLAHQDVEGNVEFFSTIARDITEEQKAARNVEIALQRQVELNNLQANVFWMTSHQFRTPLSAILSSAELLELYSSSWGAEKRTLHTQRIQKEVQRINQILDRIMLIGHLESSLSASDFSLLDLRALLEQRAGVAAEKDLLHRPIMVSSAPELLTIYSVPELVLQVLDQVLENAVLYSPAAEPVEIEATGSSAHVHICVSDRGIGIPASERGLVCQAFYRATNVGDIPGSGLGLFIVQKTLDLLDGRIDIQARPGGGTRVSIILPVRVEVEP